MRDIRKNEKPERWAKRNGVVLRLICEAEDVPAEGNASAIDEKTDAEILAWIASELNAGNDWAWCSAHVEALHVASGLKGHAYLGCCSYRSAADFRAGGYCEDMEREAIGELAQAIKRMRAAVCDH